MVALSPFQSTLPVRGATIIRCVVNLHRLRFQSTLPVRGATCRLYRDAQRFAISIHAPRAGSDTQLRRADRQKGHFNPRSPCGERHLDSIGSTKRYISIHAPRAGSDTNATAGYLTAPVISIHAPRAGSDRKHGRRNERGAISIHAPRAGSDEHALPLNQQGMWISIHAPRAGSDDNGNNKTTPSSDFNPRSPCGERPA